VAEWTKATVLKTVFVKANVGSNPTPSAGAIIAPSPAEAGLIMREALGK
jgi:hypothetical protein